MNVSSSVAEKLGTPLEAMAALRAELPDWVPLGVVGLRTRTRRSEWLELSVVAPLDPWDKRPFLIALQAPGGRTFHSTVRGCLARVRRVVA